MSDALDSPSLASVTPEAIAINYQLHIQNQLHIQKDWTDNVTQSGCIQGMSVLTSLAIPFYVVLCIDTFVPFTHGIKRFRQLLKSMLRCLNWVSYACIFDRAVVTSNTPSKYMLAASHCFL